MSIDHFVETDTARSPVALRWLDWLLMVELVALAVVLGCFLNRDTDIWWHLRAGREMLEGRGIPRVDSYLFSASGAEWIDLHWLFQVAAAAVFDRTGFAGLTLGAALAAGIAVALALEATAQRRSVLVVWCWLPAVFVMSARFYPRPEIVSLVCLAAYLLVLQKAGREPRVLWLLVPIQLAWVNVQGLFVLGLVLLSCWLVDRALRPGRTESPVAWRDRWGAPLAVLLACFANPYTWKGAVFPLTLFRRMASERGFYGQHIGELMSIPDAVMRTGVSSVYLRVAFVLLVATALSFGLQRTRGRHVWYRLFAFGVFSALGLLAGRNQPQFALIAGAVLAWNVGDWARTRPASPAVDRAVGRLLTSAVLVGLIAWVATGRFYAYAGEGRAVGLGEHPLWYAHDAATFAAREGMPRHVLAYHEGQAAVFEFHMRADQRVFVDPRLEVSPRAALEQYYALAADMARDEATWPERLRRFPQPLGILLDHGSHHAVEAALLAEGSWRNVWFDAVAGFYLPASETHVVDSHGVDFAARYFVPTRRTDGVSPGTAASMPMAAAFKRAESLFDVGTDLLAMRPADARLGRTLMLLAMADARALASRAGQWPRLGQLLAGASLTLYPVPPGDAPVADWPLETLVGVARARYLLHGVVQRAPGDFDAWLALCGIAERLGDPDALWAAGVRLTALHAADAAQFEAQRRVGALLQQVMMARAAEPPVALPMNASDVVTTARDLFDCRRFWQALSHIEQSLSDGVVLTTPSPELADLRARLFLMAGDPVSARAAWTDTATPGPQDSTLARRLATAHLVEGHLAEAAAGFRASLSSAPTQWAARYGLAMTHLESAEADGVVRECRVALANGDLPQVLAEMCRQMSEVAAPYAREPPHLAPADGEAGGQRR